MKRTEDGAALVLALVVVLLAGLLSGAIASLVATTLRFSDNIEADRQATYAADGAADWEISQLETTQDCLTGTVTPQLSVAPGINIPSFGVEVTNCGTPEDAAAKFECTFVVSAGSVTYVAADVEVFPPPASPVVKSWVDRPPQSGG